MLHGIPVEREKGTREWGSQHAKAERAAELIHWRNVGGFAASYYQCPTSLTKDNIAPSSLHTDFQL